MFIFIQLFLFLVARLVRWSVRQLASCFLACTFPQEMNPSPSLKHPMGHIVSETKDNTGDKKISDINTLQLNHSRTMSMSTNIVSVDKESKNSNRICLPNEELIVFCFKEDGAYDAMIESNRSERNSWSVNRKINSTELGSDEGRSNEDASEGEAKAIKEQLTVDQEQAYCTCTLTP